MTTNLANTFDRLKKIPFPEFAENDALSDWQAELSELDGHIAGMATTALAGGAVDASRTQNQLDDLRLRLGLIGGVGPDDQDVVRACREYLLALEEVAKSMRGGERSRK